MGGIGPKRIQKTVIPESLQALPKIKFMTYRRYRPEFFIAEPLLDICSRVVDNEKLPDCWTWTPQDVANYFKESGYPEFEEAFIVNEIDGRALILLEADKLPKINIKNFEKIKEITSLIRELYRIDQDEHKRCIDLPIRRPRTLYLWYKASRTGPTSYFMRPSSYFRKVKIIRDETTEDRRYYALLNHWNRIPSYREWCPHVMVGNIRRINPMTGTTMRQNFYPKQPPYVLKDNLCFYPCPFEETQVKPKLRFTKNPN